LVPNASPFFDLPSSFFRSSSHPQRRLSVVGFASVDDQRGSSRAQCIAAFLQMGIVIPNLSLHVNFCCIIVFFGLSRLLPHSLEAESKFESVVEINFLFFSPFSPICCKTSFAFRGLRTLIGSIAPYKFPLAPKTATATFTRHFFLPP